MTGSVLLNRQHSSTVGSSNINKMSRPKLRRCSSVDDHNSLDSILDENQSKEKLFTKYDPTLSDNDSGIEDFEQQIVKFVSSQTNDVDNEDEEDEEVTQCFDPCEDEKSTETVVKQVESVEEHHFLYHDLDLAAQISHEEKKNFCLNTCEVFHGEFARLISFPIGLQYPGIRYYLFVEDAFDTDPCNWPNFAYVKLDNAKAQFKCSNPLCNRLWTSMRARISFKISYPSSQGFVILKIYGQDCQSCNTPADALWYMEEVCRVMENLSKSIFETFFPLLIPNECSESTETNANFTKYSRRLRHDPQQRKGKMHAQHNRTHCEACQRGLCYT